MAFHPKDIRVRLIEAKELPQSPRNPGRSGHNEGPASPEQPKISAVVTDPDKAGSGDPDVSKALAAGFEMALGVRANVVVAGGRHFAGPSSEEGVNDPLARGALFMYPSDGSSALQPVPILREKAVRPSEKPRLQVLRQTEPISQQADLSNRIATVAHQQGLRDVPALVRRLGEDQIRLLARSGLAGCLRLLGRNRSLSSFAETIEALRASGTISDGHRLDTLLLTLAVVASSPRDVQTLIAKLTHEKPFNQAAGFNLSLMSGVSPVTLPSPTATVMAVIR